MSIWYKLDYKTGKREGYMGINDIHDKSNVQLDVT